jgi:hydrogenase large subunit
MKIEQIIEKIEGEAKLDFDFVDGQVCDAKIEFELFRGIEHILQDKPFLDSLVITPRVCGICNHSHLIASIRAIEDGLNNAGVDIQLSSKANLIREFTLSCELIQNHIKWFYLTISPKVNELLGISSLANYAPRASFVAYTITKAMAIFSGQWPHSSYVVIGGVSCDPTYVEILQAKTYIDEVIRFVEDVLLGVSLETYLSFSSLSSLGKLGGDMGGLFDAMSSSYLAHSGKGHDRFIVFGDCLCFKTGKSVPTQVRRIDPKYVQEVYQNHSKSKAVTYKQRQYEVGPLARGMISKDPLIKSLHKRYKDSILTRIFARMHEVAILLAYNKRVLNALDLSEPSCNLQKLDTKHISFDGVGVVEASRGSLIHKSKVKDGKIKEYEIIVPTQWNLSNGFGDEKGIAIKSMIGCSSSKEAELVFRSFDVCSACSVH